MKTSVLVFLLCLFCTNLFSQKESSLYIGLNTGAGASVQWLNLKNTSLVYNPNMYGDVKIRMWGYHVPVMIPLLFGQNKWRLGVDLGYEYMHLTKARFPDGSSTFIPPLRYTTQNTDITYHLLRVGVNFEYDVWSKNKNTIAVALRTGYFAILKPSSSSAQPPQLYGSIGVGASRELPHGFQFTYGIVLDMQGYTYYPLGDKESKTPTVFFQPQLLVGFKKQIAIKGKCRKN